MNEEAPRGAQALDALSETSPPGKLRLTTSARIDALVQAATQMVPAHGRLVEVGYDHGAILLRALQARPDITAIGVEILAPLGKLAVPTELAPRLTLRTGDGFDPLAPGECDVAILAGMGGRTIAEIVTRDRALTCTFKALVLCASHREGDIRPALATLGFGLASESLVIDRERFYEIIVARPLAECPLDDFDRDPVTAAWGPRLFASRDPLLPAFLEDTRRRFHAAFAKDLRSYRSYLGTAKAALGIKLACLDAALSRIG